MSTNITVVVEAFTGETWEEIPGLGAAFEETCYPLFDRLQALYPPPRHGYYPGGPAASHFGYCHTVSEATLDSLLGADWALPEREEGYGFIRALHAEPIKELASRYGADNVLIVFGFDS